MCLEYADHICKGTHAVHVMNVVYSCVVWSPSELTIVAALLGTHTLD